MIIQTFALFKDRRCQILRVTPPNWLPTWETSSCHGECNNHQPATIEDVYIFSNSHTRKQFHRKEDAQKYLDEWRKKWTKASYGSEIQYEERI